MRAPASLVLAVSVGTALGAPSARADGSAPASLEIFTSDGRTWDAILHEMESDPATLGREYGVGVRLHDESVPCGEYDLSFDPDVGAFMIVGCDRRSRMTRVRVVDRAHLFAAGDLVPRPRAVALHAALRGSGTALGGGDTQGGSKIWCSVFLQPYLWDGLHGVPVPLTPDRFLVRPQDLRIHAAPDGSGWIARGESTMGLQFHYDVIDRATGAKVIDDVATLACADHSVSREPPAPPATPTPEDLGEARRLDDEIRRMNRELDDEIRQAATLDATPALRLSAPSPWIEPDAVHTPEHETVSVDMRMIVAGAIFAPSIQQEVLGAQVGIGGFVSDRWYFGGAARWTMAIDMGQDEGSLSHVLQAGPEGRYLIANTGRDRPGHVRLWTGLRGGYEDVQPAGSAGGFAETALGFESGSPRFRLSMALATGTGFDSPGAYGDASLVHLYVDYSIGVSFGG